MIKSGQIWIDKLFQRVNWWKKDLSSKCMLKKAVLLNIGIGKAPLFKVIIEKSLGEGSLIEQDTIENVS